MRIRNKDDVDKFFDKFEDPSLELERILEALDLAAFEGESGTQQYFIKRLIMKSYRLGKDHAYDVTLGTIRARNRRNKDE